MKYHQNSGIVESIIKAKAGTGAFPHSAYDCSQEDLNDWEKNPDVPDMRLYRCWDSSAVITSEESKTSIITTKEGEVSASDASAGMPGT